MIRAVIFDLDDTLYDEIDYCRSGFQAVAEFLIRVHKVACAPDELQACLWRHFSSGNRGRTFNAALTELGLAFNARLIAGLIRVYRAHTPKLKLSKETRDVLRHLGRSHDLAILTDGYLPAQRLKIRALGIAPYLECIFYTEHLGRAFWKPSTAGFIRVLDALQVRPSEAIYVGDNPAKDFIAPNRLGMESVQVLRPLRLRGQPASSPEAAPGHTVDCLSQIPALLQSLD
jgi:putative hydrolase of the HAD superfamily